MSSGERSCLGTGLSLSDLSLAAANILGREGAAERPIAVTHVLQPSHSGVPNVVLSLADHQVRRGWDTTVVGPTKNGFPDRVTALGARFVSWNASRDPNWRVLDETRSLARRLSATRSDLFHLHSSKAGLCGRLALRKRAPTIFQPHAWSFAALDGPLRRPAIAWERLGARWCDAIVCVSLDERDSGVRSGISARWAVVPNGIDLNSFAPADDADRHRARAALAIGESPLVVLLGRVSPQKGADTLVAAWPKVRERVPDAHLALVGDGYDECDGASQRGIIRRGRQDDVRPWVVAANVVALPSRWEAGLSLAAMEAMATARSVVLGDTWGARAGIDDNGAVVPVDDHIALADALVPRLLDPAAADREGLNARRRIEEHFDLRRVLCRMDNTYMDVLAGRRREFSAP